MSLFGNDDKPKGAVEMVQTARRESRAARIELHTCSICGHHKAWGSRGMTMPQYLRKCTKCGNISR